jgi:glycogen phosphorylase
MRFSIRDRLIKRWNRTQTYVSSRMPKRVYYLSLEFLMGRSLQNAILNIGIEKPFREALKQMGCDLEELYEEELDAALGNGGLGRLAACFMDSLATLNYPAWGYGLRYNYGIFEQRIVDEHQVEFPDYWLNFGNPWEIPRLDVVYPVRFYGTVQKMTNESGHMTYRWKGGETVLAIAYDVPIPGYDTTSTINVRLWSSKPNKQFDLASFNEGNYEKSVGEQQRAENITSVLYPNDHTYAGKELRLKQQYFFVCATLQDIIRRFKKSNLPWSDFPNKVAIQLNDTHPALSIVELQRVLVDVEGLNWDEAWTIVTRTYAFTNHTVLPEALEKWPLPLMQTLLPRHLQLIFDINLFFLQAVEARFPNDLERLTRMSIIEEGQPQLIRMAWLAVIGSHTVNGVAAIHSELIRTTVFRDFVDFYGVDKFQNKTNGVTPRRWLHQANPSLSALISEALGGDRWLTDLSLLAGLRSYADDISFQERWMAIKHANKVHLSQYIREKCGIHLNPNMMFDVQVKRIHEYKRQLLNILGVIHRYWRLKEMPAEERKKFVPRAVIFGGKAAPGYYIAKLIIYLINIVAQVVNSDPDMEDLLRVVFIPNYNVSLAEKIVPASDLSQHISLAGTEASGTSNMKFVLNGGLILGTLDGANVEILEEIGKENIFIFGVTADRVRVIRHEHRFRHPVMDPQLKTVLQSLYDGKLGPFNEIHQLLDTLGEAADHYLVSDDFASYLQAQDEVDRAFLDRSAWARKSILCTAGMGRFSSDRSIHEYAEHIWNLKPLPIPTD